MPKPIKFSLVLDDQVLVGRHRVRGLIRCSLQLLLVGGVQHLIGLLLTLRSTVAAAVPSIPLFAAQRVSNSRGSVPTAGGGPIIPAAGGGTRILGAPQLSAVGGGTRGFSHSNC